MNEYNALTIEKLDKEEFAAAMKAINEVRQARANEAAKKKAVGLIENAIVEALNLVHPEEILNELYDLYLEVKNFANEELKK